MNKTLIQIWIITVKDGTINLAHCLRCKVGVVESCLHIASVLFYLEAWTNVNGKLACTQMKCSGILPRFGNELEYAQVWDIDFRSSKKLKGDLDERSENLGEDLVLSGISKGYTESAAPKPEVPARTQEEIEDFCRIFSISVSKTLSDEFDLIKLCFKLCATQQRDTNFDGFV